MKGHFKSTGFLVSCIAVVVALLIAVGAFALPGSKTVVAEGQSDVRAVAVPMTKSAIKQMSGACAGVQQSIEDMANPDDAKDKKASGKKSSKNGGNKGGSDASK